MNIQKQIDAIKAAKAANQNEITGITGKAIEKGLTPDADQEAQIKTLEADIAVLDTNLKRLETILKSQATTATPVAGADESQAQKSAGGDPNPANVEVNSNLPAGIGFAIMVKASALAAHSKGQISATDVLKAWNAPEIVQKALVQKALVGATNEATFGASLVDYQNLTGEFIELLRKKTVVDKIAGNMRQVPFNIKMPSQSGTSVVNWVGEKQTKPVTNPTYGSTTLTKSKVAGIVIVSEELMRFSNPKADLLIRDDLIASSAQFIDASFFDPTKTDTDASPASVLNGVTPITSTGDTAVEIEADLIALVSQLTAANIPLEGAVWVMSETRAITLASMKNPLGANYFEGMNLAGERTLKGLRVETTGATEDKIVLVVPSQIMIADDGVMDFAISTEASINMGTDQSPNWLNLFQNNLMALRGERYIRWKKRYALAAGYIQY